MRPLDETALEPGTLVIADLHLDVEDPGTIEPFVAWLGRARGAPRLIVLGDLFEFWIGPAQLGSPHARSVLSAIRDLVASGTAVDVVPGNRDFLLDRHFQDASDARVRQDGMVGRTAAGERVLFLHGDELSTFDVGHQRMRRVLRSGPIRWLAPRLPRRVAYSIARRLRRASRSATREKEAAVMEMQPDAVRVEAARHRAEVLVCGHGHVFRDEALEGGLRWVVLDAFGGRNDTLVLSEAAADFRLAPSTPAAGA